MSKFSTHVSDDSSEPNLLKDEVTGVLYELDDAEMGDVLFSGEVPAHIADLIKEHRAEQTLDLANAVEDAATEVERRLNQREMDRAVQRWVEGKIER